MKSLKICALAFVFSFLSSCTCHHFDEVKAPFKVGHVLCSDGAIMSLCDFAMSDKEAIGIVFKVNEDVADGELGYAVYINDMGSFAFAEQLGIAQNTSANVDAEDGNENTYSLYTSQEVKSPMAEAVFDMWRYGQSAYVPSVAQMKLLFSVKEFINRRIEAVGGEPIVDDFDHCWFWTSTEVAGQQENKGWLYFMNSGSVQETPKNQEHKVRPVITIRR